MALSSARRVVLLSYNATTHTIDFRHFLISVRPVGVSKPIRKLIAGSTNNKAVPLKRRLEDINGGTSESEASDAEGEQKEIVKFRPVPSKKASGKAKGILDLSKASDISDYILRQEAMGFVTSDSEMSDMSDGGGSSAGSDSEADEKKGKVRLAGDYVGRGNRGKGVRGDKRAVRLVELGPRMEMGLVKIEEGVGEGEVLFHEMGTSRTAAPVILALLMSGIDLLCSPQDESRSFGTRQGPRCSTKARCRTSCSTRSERRRQEGCEEQWKYLEGRWRGRWRS